VTNFEPATIDIDRLIEERQVIDARSDPEQATQVAESITAAADPMPLMSAPPSNVVPLPGGYIDSDGVLHTEVRIREINGSDEEAMARELLNPNVNIPKVVDLLLKRTVLSVGLIDNPVQTGVLAKMLTGDRAAVIMGVRTLTFGTDWEVPDFPCKFCGQTFGCIVELDSIPIKKLDDPTEQEIDVELRHDRIARMRLLTGAVQLEMVGDGKRTAPEEVTTIIDRCLVSLDGQPVRTPMGKKMSMADRRKIVQAMADSQPGPRMEEVGVTCTECGREGDYTASVVDIFR